MAEHRGSFGTDINDANRDGIDDDIDGKPGNRWESPAYAKHYDPIGRQEFSNLPEAPAYLAMSLRERQAEQERKEQLEAQRAEAERAKSAVFFKHDFGKFIVPKDNTWAAHAAIVCDNATQLSFSPERYPVFDKIIAERAKIPALYDASHPDYEKYEPLRTNLEVLRNDIIGDYMHDGSFDEGDEKYIPHIMAIAETIGDALGADHGLKRILQPSISVEVANVEGVGANEIYKLLYAQQQRTKGYLGFLVGNMRDLLHMPDRNWGLPKIDDTPFGAAGLSAPPPPTIHHLNDDELAAACATKKWADRNQLNQQQTCEQRTR